MANKASAFRAMMESIGFIRPPPLPPALMPLPLITDAVADVIADADNMMKAVSGIPNSALLPPPLPSAQAPFTYPDVHLLKARLNIRPTWDFPWQPTIIVRGSDVISVIIGKGNGYVTVLEDDVNLFPSDTLVGKLRLLQP
jgi:hypothetical protein